MSTSDISRYVVIDAKDSDLAEKMIINITDQNIMEKAAVVDLTYCQRRVDGCSSAWLVCMARYC